MVQPHLVVLLERRPDLLEGIRVHHNFGPFEAYVQVIHGTAIGALPAAAE